MGAAASLDNYTNIFTSEGLEGSVLKSRKFLHKLETKHKMGLAMAYQIRDYVEQAGIKMCGNWKATREHNRLDEKDGGNAEYRELVNLYYQLTRTGMGVGTLFEKDGKRELFAAGVFYSKNRFSPVWNYRKSRLIRSCYGRWIAENYEQLRKMTPVHLVLTVPHGVDGFGGEEFYARKLVEMFRDLRRKKLWKDNIKGGEYCLEVTKNENGYHIHIHSLVFQSNTVTVNQMRAWVRQAWGEMTGNDTGYSGIHYETLYYRDKENKVKVDWVTGVEVGTYDTEDIGSWGDDYSAYVCYDDLQVVKSAWVSPKRYINEHSTQEEWLFGVLECIKYHFKDDTAVITGTKQGRPVYDIDLIKNILNNTKSLRMYDRFGFLRKEDTLNFSRLEKQSESVESEEEEEEGGASVRTFEEKLIDPFTGEPAAPGSYKTVYFHLAFIHTAPKASGYKVLNLDKKGVIRDAECGPAMAFRAVVERMKFQADFYKLLTG